VRLLSELDGGDRPAEERERDERAKQAFRGDETDLVWTMPQPHTASKPLGAISAHCGIRRAIVTLRREPCLPWWAAV